MVDIINIAGSFLTPLFLFWLLIEQIKTNKLITKNQITTMAQLSDFHNVVAQIETATTNISSYVQGTGMSSADQDTALKAIQDAVTALHAIVPASAPVEVAP